MRWRSSSAMPRRSGMKVFISLLTDRQRPSRCSYAMERQTLPLSRWGTSSRPL
jgi:hypothetical protein